MGDVKAPRPRGAAGILSIVTEVREGEAGRALILTLNFFLLFVAYYTLKPIREALILSMDGGAEIKSNASGWQALAFMLIIPAYGALARRFSGRGILVLIYLFLASNLLAFIYLDFIGFAYLPVVFFVWVGMFNLMIVSQTWSLCNDIYTEEEGRRLFPLIAFGAASGAVFGPRVFDLVVRSKDLVGPMATGGMAVAAALIVLAAVLIRFSTPSHTARRLPESPLSEWKRLAGGFGLIFSSRYLLCIAGLVLVINFVNTNSEYMLGKLVSEHAKASVAAGLAGGATADVLIGAFFSRFFFWVNLAVLALQLFAVSRVLRYLGLSTALYALPVLALISYSTVIFFPLLAIVRVVKIAENATDYSLNATAREILFLPLSREEKYKAKFAVDTFFWRGGDLLSNAAVRTLAGLLGLGITAFAGLNALLVLVWIFLVYCVCSRTASRGPSWRTPSSPARSRP